MYFHILEVVLKVPDLTSTDLDRVQKSKIVDVTAVGKLLFSGEDFSSKWTRKKTVSFSKRPVLTMRERIALEGQSFNRVCLTPNKIE
jgi:hypothetical protein